MQQSPQNDDAYCKHHVRAGQPWSELVLCAAEVLLSRSDIADLRAAEDACIDTALPAIVGWSREVKPLGLKTGVHADLVKQASDLLD